MRALLIFLCSVFTLRAAVDLADDMPLMNSLVRDSQYEAAYLAAEKGGRLEAVIQYFDRQLEMARDSHGPDALDRSTVPRALLLERMGSLGEAKATLAEDRRGVIAAWHLARLGDTQALRGLRSQVDGLNAVFIQMLQETDAARRTEFRTLLEKQLTEFQEPALRVMLVRALAEFAFQEGRLAEFVAAQEKEAEAAAGEAQAMLCLTVSGLHSYLYDAAKSHSWRLRAVEKAGGSQVFWDDFAHLIAAELAEARNGGLRPAFDAGKYFLETITHRPVTAEARARLVNAWLESDAITATAWLKAYPEEMARAAPGLLRALSQGQTSLLWSGASSDLADAAAGRTDSLECRLLRAYALEFLRQKDEAKRELEQVFRAAGSEWLRLADGKSPDVLSMEKYLGKYSGLPPEDGASREEWVAHVRQKAWLKWAELAGPEAMHQLARREGAALFVSPEEAIARLKEAGCRRMFYEQLGEWMKARQGPLPPLFAKEAAYDLPQINSGLAVPQKDRERLLGIARSIIERELATDLPSSHAGGFLAAVKNLGSREEAQRLAARITAEAEKHRGVKRWENFADAAARTMAPPSARQSGEPVPVEQEKPTPSKVAAAHQRAVPLPACGAWFHPLPFGEKLRYFSQSGMLLSSGRYAAPPGMNQLTKDDMEKLPEPARLRALLFQSRSGNEQGTPPPALPLVEAMLKTAPNDDLRLILVQLLLRPAWQELVRREEVQALPAERAETALKTLDEITTTAGAWPLLKAVLRAGVLRRTGQPAEADKVMTILAERGYVVLPDQAAVHQAARTATTADGMMAQLKELVKKQPDKKQEAVDLFRRIVRRQEEFTPGIDKALESAEKAGFLNDEEAAAREEMKAGRLSTIIANNLFQGFRYLTEDAESLNPRWLPYAEYLVARGFPETTPAEELARHFRQQKKPKEAAAVLTRALEKAPALSLETWCDPSLAGDLLDAGLLGIFVQHKAKWLREAPPDRDNTPASDAWTGIERFITQLLDMPGGQPHAKELLAAWAASRRVNGGIRDMEKRAPIFTRAGAEPEFAAMLARELGPSMPESIEDSADYPYARQVRRLDLRDGWEQAGRDQPPPLFGMLELVKKHGHLPALREALEAETRKEQAPLGTAEQVQLLFPVRVFAEPEKLAEHLRNACALSPLSPAARLLPGMTERLWIRAAFEGLSARPANGSTPGRGASARYELHQLLNRTLNDHDAAADTELLRDLATAVAKELQSGQINLPQRELAAATITAMCKASMRAEAGALYERLLQDWSPHPASAIALHSKVREQSAAAGDAALEQKAASALTAALKALQPGTIGQEDSHAIYSLAEASAAEGKFEDAHALLKLLKPVSMDEQRYRSMMKRIEMAEGKPGGLATWIAQDTQGALRFCWHTSTAAGANERAASNPRITWEAGRRPVPAPSVAFLFTSDDRKQWADAGSVKLETVAGSTVLRTSSWLRSHIQSGAGVEFIEPTVLGRAVISSATGGLPGLAVASNRGASFESAAAPEWTAIPQDAHPGAAGWTTQLKVEPGKTYRVHSEPFEIDPLEIPRLSGWLKLESDPRVSLSFTFRSTDASIPPAGFMAATLEDGAWCLFQEGYLEEIARMPRRSAGFYIVLELSGFSNAATVRLSICDLLLRAATAEGLPPWPQKVIGHLQTSDRDTPAMYLAPDGSFLLAAFRYGGLVRIPANGGPAVRLGKPPQGELRAVGIAPSGSHIFALADNGHIYRLNASEPSRSVDLGEQPSRNASSMAVSPDGNVLAIPVTGEGVLHLRRVVDGKLSAPVTIPLPRELSDFAVPVFSTDGKRLVFVYRQRRNSSTYYTGQPPPSVRVFSTEDGSIVPPLKKEGKEVPDFTAAEDRGNSGNTYISAAGWKAAITFGERSASFKKAEDQKAQEWKVPALHVHWSTVDPKTGTAFTLESSGHIRRWELPQK